MTGNNDKRRMTDNDEAESETARPTATATPTPTETAPDDEAALPAYLQQLASIGAESSDAVNSLTELIQNARATHPCMAQ